MTQSTEHTGLAATVSIGGDLTVGGKPAYANVRAYYEFWSQNRVKGYAAFATLVLPLGK